MVGLMQIMIYMLAVYLVYKGFEIFQIAFVSKEGQTRTAGIIFGVCAIVAAVVIGFMFVFWADSMAASISDKMGNIGR